MSTDDSMREYTRNLFGKALGQPDATPPVDLVTSNHVPNEGVNPRARSSLSWDMREWVEQLFYGGGPQ